MEEEEEGTGYRSVLGDLGSPGRFSWLLIHLAKSGLTTDLPLRSLPFPLLVDDLDAAQAAAVPSTSYIREAFESFVKLDSATTSPSIFNSSFTFVLRLSMG